MEQLQNGGEFTNHHIISSNICVCFKWRAPGFKQNAGQRSPRTQNLHLASTSYQVEMMQYKLLPQWDDSQTHAKKNTKDDSRVVASVSREFFSRVLVFGRYGYASGGGMTQLSPLK